MRRTVTNAANGEGLESEPNKERSRRSFLRTGLAIGAGGLLAATGVTSLTPTPAAAESGAQGNWAWCNKCQGLFYAGFPGPAGRCTAGGAHYGTPSSSYDYTMYFDNGPPAPSDDNYYQYNWRYCNKCYALAYAGHGPGPCPAGGRHNTASHNYSMYHGPIYDPNHQPGYQLSWWWCSKCEAIAYGGHGPCRAGGRHDILDSYNYVMFYWAPPY